MCDPYGSAASAAQTAFSTAFTPAKQTDALKFGLKSIIAVCYTHKLIICTLCSFLWNDDLFLSQFAEDVTLKQTQDTFSDPK